MFQNVLLKLLTTVTLISIYSCDSENGNSKSMIKSVENGPSFVYGSEDLEGTMNATESSNGNNMYGSEDLHSFSSIPQQSEQDTPIDSILAAACANEKHTYNSPIINKYGGPNRFCRTCNVNKTPKMYDKDTFICSVEEGN